jgi:beta-glucanase (GH16 family)
MLSCGEKAEALAPQGMTLVWADDFEIDGAPEMKKWGYDIGGHGWGNAEAETYTNNRENSSIANGVLRITARNDSSRWTSARIKTQDIAHWTYGYFEIRAKLPSGTGTWPAIWMLPNRDRYGTWPNSGEIDIMEHVGFDPNRIHTTMHSGAYNHQQNTQKGTSLMVENVTGQFHTYGIEWESRYIQWFIDDKPVYRYENPGLGTAEWPFDIPYYLIMNIAIGGSWGGQKGIDPALREAVMEIDYVRVYQKP